MTDTIKTEHLLNDLSDHLTLTFLTTVIPLWILVTHAGINQSLVSVDQMLTWLDSCSIFRFIFFNGNWEIKSIVDFNTANCIN